MNSDNIYEPGFCFHGIASCVAHLYFCCTLNIDHVVLNIFNSS